MSSRPVDPVISLPGEPLTLRHSFLWTLAGNVFYAGTQWLALVVIAKLTTPVWVGQFALATAVTYPVTLIVNLQLRVLFLTDASRRFTLRTILGFRYAMALVALVFVTVIARANDHANDQSTSLTVLIAASQLVDCISDTYYGICQRYERNDRISQSLILRGGLGLASLAIAVYWTGSLVIGAAAMLSARLLLLLLFDASRRTFGLALDDPTILQFASSKSTLASRVWPEWHTPLQLTMLWTALPLGLVSALVAFNSNVPRYMLGRYLGPYDLGIFSALSTFPAAGAAVANAVGYAAFSRLIAHYNSGSIGSYIRLIFRLLAVVALVGVTGMLFTLLWGKTMLTLLFRPEYAEHSRLLVWLMGIGVVTYTSSCLGVAMTAASKFHAQMILFAVITVASFILCRLLVPLRGLDGAVAGSLIAGFMQLLGAAWIIFRATSLGRKDACEAVSLPVA